MKQEDDALREIRERVELAQDVLDAGSEPFVTIANRGHLLKENILEMAERADEAIADRSALLEDRDELVRERDASAQAVVDAGASWRAIAHALRAERDQWKVASKLWEQNARSREEAFQRESGALRLLAVKRHELWQASDQEAASLRVEIAKWRESAAHWQHAYGELGLSSDRVILDLRAERDLAWQQFMEEHEALLCEAEKGDALRAALRGLVTKLDEVFSHPDYQYMLTLAHTHGGYTGPECSHELETARAVLAVEPGASPPGTGPYRDDDVDREISYKTSTIAVSTYEPNEETQEAIRDARAGRFEPLPIDAEGRGVHRDGGEPGRGDNPGLGTLEGRAGTTGIYVRAGGGGG